MAINGLLSNLCFLIPWTSPGRGKFLKLLCQIHDTPSKFSQLSIISGRKSMKFLNVTLVTFVTWNTYKLVQSRLVSIFYSSIKSLHFNQIQLCQQSFPNLRYPFNSSLLYQFIICSQVQVLPSVQKVFPSLWLSVSLSLPCLSPFNSYNRYCLFYSFWIIHYMRHPHKCITLQNLYDSCSFGIQNI